MQKQLAVFLLALLIAALASAQPTNEWVKTYGVASQDEGEAICATSDGNFVIFGESAGPNRDFVIKVDRYGNRHWYRSLSQGTKAREILETADGGFVLVGSYQDNGLVLRLDAYGGVIWQQLLDLPVPVGFTSVTRSNDGGFVVTGLSDDDPADLLLVKYDQSGNQVWSGTFPDPEERHELAAYIGTISTGGYVVLATVVPVGGGPREIHVFHFTTYGALIDIHIFNGFEQAVYGGALQLDGSVIIAGQRESVALAMKVTVQGELAWEQTYPAGQAFRCALVTEDEDYYFGGISTSDDFLIVRAGPQGGQAWTLTTSQPGDNLLNDLALTPEFHVYGVGGVDVTPDNQDVGLWAVGLPYMTPNFSLTLFVHNAPVIIPPGGGAFNYNVFITNNTAVPRQVRVRRQGYTPTHTLLTVADYNVTLQTGMNPGFAAQPVPAGAPAGSYAFIYTISTTDTDSLLATDSTILIKAAE